MGADTKRDTDLVSGMYFAEGVGNAERYWRREAGSDTPTWEIVMGPPVEITGRAVASGSD